MKTIFCLLILLTLLCFSIMYVASPWLDLQYGVAREVGNKNFHGAKLLCEHALSLRPTLFPDRAKARLGEVSIAAADAELQKSRPDFSAAQDWLADLLKRSGSPTGSEDRAAHMLKEMPSLHYNYARQIFLQGDYERALAEFQEIGRLYPDDSVQERLKTEAQTAEIEVARKLNDAGDPEAAIDRLARLSAAGHLPPVMVSKAQGAVPALAERAIRARIRLGNFTTAFNLMDSIEARFTDPDVLSGLADTRARIDLELFNVALESGLHGKNTPSNPRREYAGAAEKAVVQVKNRTGSPMRLIYVGPERVEVELPANSERNFELAPGRYLTGVYWPTDRRLRPSRAEDVIQAGLFRKSFEVSPQRQDAAYTRGSMRLPIELD